jgi:hypothetical protein
MKRSMRRGFLAAALACSACIPGRGTDGESYRVGGDPWAVRPPAKEADRSSSAGDTGEGDHATPSGAGDHRPVSADGTGRGTPPGTEPAAAPPSASIGDLAAGTGTVLEQLDTARRRAAELDGENRRLVGEVAALTAVVDQLKRDNQNLAQLAQASQESRTVVDGELDSLQAKIKDLELRSRQLADDLLAERIKRVRVERQLILAKVTEAESQGDGP